MWFAVWLVVGAAYAVSLLGAASIGLFVLPLPVFVTILLVRQRSARGGAPGVVSGLGVPLFYVVYLNRSGPGTMCTPATDGGMSCVDQSSPWPWLAVAAILFLLGFAVFIVRQRHLVRV
jgi:hypothetical protein